MVSAHKKNSLHTSQPYLQASNVVQHCFHLCSLPRTSFGIHLPAMVSGLGRVLGSGSRWLMVWVLGSGSRWLMVWVLGSGLRWLMVWALVSGLRSHKKNIRHTNKPYFQARNAVPDCFHHCSLPRTSFYIHLPAMVSGLGRVLVSGLRSHKKNIRHTKKPYLQERNAVPDFFHHCSLPRTRCCIQTWLRF